MVVTVKSVKGECDNRYKVGDKIEIVRGRVTGFDTPQH